jgi:hypothetical protein
VAACLVFLSLVGTKRTIYLLPVIPMSAVALAGAFDERLKEGPRRPGLSLWICFGAVAASAMSVPLLPAADGQVGRSEITLSFLVGVICACVATALRTEASRLFPATLSIAFGSLLLLELFSLPRMDLDRPARQFFGRVDQKVSGGRVYSLDLNEDVLGRACLGLKRPPVSETNEIRLRGALAYPDAFLISETVSAPRTAKRLNLHLEFIETGEAGGRSIGLYRCWTRDGQ